MTTCPEGTIALVVDDDPVTRLLVKRALEGFGCVDVLEASDGLAAQASAARTVRVLGLDRLDQPGALDHRSTHG